MIDDVLKELNDTIDKAHEALVRELSKVRTGRAHPSILDRVRVDYYGVQTPISQMANVGVPDATLLTIKPWEKTQLQPIDKAIREAGIGLNPQVDGEIIRVPIPPLTEERRKEMVKLTKRYGEDAKISVRQHRRDAMDMIAEAVKEGEVGEDEAERAKKKVEEIVAEAQKQVDKTVTDRESQIMEVEPATMTCLVIVGAQWGDEGKGKVVDLLSERAQVVVRYAGGPNAGHTLVVGDDKIVLRLIPSGVLHAHTFCVLGQGMVINPTVLLEEIEALETRGHQVRDRMVLSDRAHLILPYHVSLDGLRESSAQGTKIGTTKRGIGPCYEDKAARRGVRTGDLRNPTYLRSRIEETLASWAPTFSALGDEVPEAGPIVDTLLAQGETLLPLLRETSRHLDDRIRGGAAVMLEGAQGTLLDLDHGTYPFVTSSSAVAGGACTGAGIGPSRISRVLGITKAYTTRVGEGPFPTELDDDAGQRLRDQGHEYGSVTGRPRRTGWLDLAALRYATRVNGLDALAITKLDVLTGLDTLQVCVAYETPDGPTDALPAGRMDDAVPVYETLPGWKDDLTGCRSLDELPEAAQAYLRFVAERTELEIDLVSVGPRRDQTIVVRESFA